MASYRLALALTLVHPAIVGCGSPSDPPATESSPDVASSPYDRAYLEGPADPLALEHPALVSLDGADPIDARAVAAEVAAWYAAQPESPPASVVREHRYRLALATVDALLFRGEATRRGVSVTAAEVDAALAAFGSSIGGLDVYLARTGKMREAVRSTIETQLVADRLTGVSGLLAGDARRRLADTLRTQHVTAEPLAAAIRARWARTAEQAGAPEVVARRRARSITLEAP